MLPRMGFAETAQMSALVGQVLHDLMNAAGVDLVDKRFEIMDSHPYSR
jgi:hypothetical protein